MNQQISLSITDHPITYIFLLLILVVLPGRSYLKYRSKYAGSKRSIWNILEYFPFLAILFYCLRENGLSFDDIGLSFHDGFFISAAKIVFSTGVVVGLDILSLSVALKSSGLVSDQKGETDPIVFSEKSHVNAAMIFIACILGGFWEETVFRGAVFYFLNVHEVPILLTIMGSSAFFAFHHLYGGVKQVIHSLIFGLLFALLYYVTNSLVSVIVAHIAGNLFAIFIARPLVLGKNKEKPILF